MENHYYIYEVRIEEESIISNFGNYEKLRRELLRVPSVYQVETVTQWQERRTIFIFSSSFVKKEIAKKINHIVSLVDTFKEFHNETNIFYQGILKNQYSLIKETLKSISSYYFGDDDNEIEIKGFKNKNSYSVFVRKFNHEKWFKLAEFKSYEMLKDFFAENFWHNEQGYFMPYEETEAEENILEDEPK